MMHRHNTLWAGFLKALQGAFKIYLDHKDFHHPRHSPHQQTWLDVVGDYIFSGNSCLLHHLSLY